MKSYILHNARKQYIFKIHFSLFMVNKGFVSFILKISYKFLKHFCAINANELNTVQTNL